MSQGGKGSNQAVAAHRLGDDVYMIGKIGVDAFGEELSQFFKSEGILTDHIVSSEEAPTGAAFVAVDGNAENVIYVSGGANDALNPEDVEHLSIEPDDTVSATLETPIQTTQFLFKKAKAVGATTILNAAPAILEAKSLFPLCDYLIMNETELALFTDKDTVNTEDEAVKAMADLAEPKNIITTLGSKGVVAIFNKEQVAVSGKKVDAVDSTGAGDCFVGAFVVALSENKTHDEALHFANTAAALSVQKVGASSSIPRRDEVDVLID